MGVPAQKSALSRRSESEYRSMSKQKTKPSSCSLMMLRSLLFACIVVSLRAFVLQPRLSSSSRARFATNNDVSSIRDRTLLDSIKTWMVTAAVVCAAKIDPVHAAATSVETKPIITDMVHIPLDLHPV